MRLRRVQVVASIAFLHKAWCIVGINQPYEIIEPLSFTLSLKLLNESIFVKEIRNSYYLDLWSISIHILCNIFFWLVFEFSEERWLPVF